MREVRQVRTCYREFPRSTLIYNGVTLGASFLVGVLLAAQFGIGVAVGYLLLASLAGAGVLMTVCARCGYYGRRCALGIGRVAARVARKGPEDEFLGTGWQIGFTGLLVVVLLLPVMGGIVLLARGVSVERLTLLGLFLGLLLAGLVPHPWLVCAHCCQGEQGRCPVGRWLRDRREGGRDATPS